MEFRFARHLHLLILLASQSAVAGPLDQANITAATGAFNAMQTASLSSLYGSCQATALGGALGTVAGCLDAPPGDIKEVSKNLSCEAFSVGGSFNFDAADKKLKQFEGLEKGISCQKAKVEGARGQLQCLSGQASALASQIAALASEYQRNISRMQNDISQLNSQIQDRKQQSEFVAKRLRGDESTGRVGLLEARNKLQAKVKEMFASVSNLKRQVRELEANEKILEEKATQRTMALTQECFENRRSERFVCGPNQPPVTLKEYVLCRVQQQQSVENGGQIEDTQLSRERGGATRGALEALLTEIFSQAPKDKSINAQTDRVQVLTADELLKKYESRLKVFDAPVPLSSRASDAKSRRSSLPVYAFLKANIKSCFNEQAKVVKRERQMSSTELGVAQKNIKNQGDEVTRELKQRFQDFNEAYVETLEPLTGMGFSLNTLACEKDTNERQLSCLSKITYEVQASLMGNAEQSRIIFSVPSNRPENGITFECRGIVDCTNKLQNVDTSLKQEVTKAGAFKRDYVQRANQSIEQFTVRMSQALGQQNQAIKGKIDEINGMLSSLGIKGAIKADAVDAEQFEKDGDSSDDDEKGMGGLYKMPKNLLSLVGGKMSPVMLDVKPSSFESAFEGIADEAKSLDDKRTRITEAIDRLAVLKSECSGKEEDKIQEKLDGLIGKIRECTNNINFCEGSGPAAIRDLINDIKGISELGDKSDITGALDVGIADCARKRAQFENLSTEKADEKRAGESSGASCSSVTSQVTSTARRLGKARSRRDKAESKSGTAL